MALFDQDELEPNGYKCDIVGYCGKYVTCYEYQIANI